MGNSKRILLLGGGGHCHSVLDSIIGSASYDEIGIIDEQRNTYMGVSVIGSDDDLETLKKEGWNYAFVTVGSIGKTDTRRRLYNKLKAIGFVIPRIIDATAIIARDVMMDEGVYIGKGAIINAGSCVGKCAIINTGSIIEHDCKIGDFTHVSPGVVICGGSTVGDDSHVGAGTILRQQISVGKGTLIGAGSVVVKDIPDFSKAYGNPCKVVG